MQNQLRENAELKRARRAYADDDDQRRQRAYQAIEKTAPKKDDPDG